MTTKEREHPEILNGSRKKRIATGSGTNIQEVNRLIKQFDDMHKMMKLMNNKSAMAGMMKMMGGKMPFGK
jgi:signal recognition particle subunit SRP54